MAAPTLQDMLNRIYVLVGMDADNVIFALDAGDNSGITVTQQVNAAALLWDIARMFCQTCLPLYATATGTLPAGANAGGMTVVDLESVLSTVTRNGSAAPAGTILWASDTVAVNGTYLNYLGEQQLRIVSGPGTAAVAQPLYFAPIADGRTIAVGPPATAALPLQVDGVCLPPLLVNTTDDWSAFFPDDLVIEVFTAGAAAMGALWSYDDPRVRERMMPFAELYNDAVMRYWERLDPYTRAKWYGHMGATPRLLMMPEGGSGPAQAQGG